MKTRNPETLIWLTNFSPFPLRLSLSPLIKRMWLPLFPCHKAMKCVRFFIERLAKASIRVYFHTKRGTRNYMATRSYSASYWMLTCNILFIYHYMHIFTYDNIALRNVYRYHTVLIIRPTLEFGTHLAFVRNVQPGAYRGAYTNALSTHRHSSYNSSSCLT